MNYGLILAGGVGQRMRNSGLPKQFLNLLGKPIIIYTLEKFDSCEDIDHIVVVCHNEWIDYMNNLVKQFHVSKVTAIVAGGNNRQESITHGLHEISRLGGHEAIVVIHDGVRPLVEEGIIRENIRVARELGNAMTVRSVTESVVVTDQDTASITCFQKRQDTYTLTSPQTFRVNELIDAFDRVKGYSQSEIPLLDASLVYAELGKNINLVKEQGLNLKVTTPEDFYYLRAILEMEENKYIFGL